MYPLCQSDVLCFILLITALWWLLDSIPNACYEERMDCLGLSAFSFDYYSDET